MSLFLTCTVQVSWRQLIRCYSFISDVCRTFFVSVPAESEHKRIQNKLSVSSVKTHLSEVSPKSSSQQEKSSSPGGEPVLEIYYKHTLYIKTG